MIELYFTLQVIGFVIVFGVLVVVLLSCFIKCLISSLKQIRIEKYLTSIGYKRDLISTAAFGDNHTYGYKRLNDNDYYDIIRDYELRGMSFKQVKQKYK